jgi:hypothetical protein
MAALGCERSVVNGLFLLSFEFMEHTGAIMAKIIFYLIGMNKYVGFFIKCSRFLKI